MAPGITQIWGADGNMSLELRGQVTGTCFERVIGLWIGAHGVPPPPLCPSNGKCMVHVPKILRGFKAEMVVHKQRVDSATESS